MPARLGACGASLSSPGRLVLSDLTRAGNRQMAHVRQHHILPNWLCKQLCILPYPVLALPGCMPALRQKDKCCMTYVTCHYMCTSSDATCPDAVKIAYMQKHHNSHCANLLYADLSWSALQLALYLQKHVLMHTLKVATHSNALHCHECSPAACLCRSTTLQCDQACSVVS